MGLTPYLVLRQIYKSLHCRHILNYLSVDAFYTVLTVESMLNQLILRVYTIEDRISILGLAWGKNANDAKLLQFCQECLQMRSTVYVNIAAKFFILKKWLAIKYLHVPRDSLPLHVPKRDQVSKLSRKSELDPYQAQSIIIYSFVYWKSPYS
jgi:hypothetical protein